MSILYKERIQKRFARVTLFILFYTIISGALRKWVFITGGTGSILQMLQITMPFLYLSMPNIMLAIRKNFLLKLYFFYLIISIFNPLNLTIYHGLLGLIIHGNFWIMAMIYLAYRDELDLSKYYRWFIIVIFIEVVLGFIQYQLPQGHFLNRYADIEQIKRAGIATIGDAVRVTGTFSYIGGFTAVIPLIALMTWVLINRKANRFLIFSVLIGGFIAALMSGSRGAMGMYILVLLLMASNNRSMFTFKRFGVLIVPAIVLFLIIIFNSNSFIYKQIHTSFENFSDRTTKLAESGEQERRILTPIAGIYNFRGKYPFFGVGLGATYQGATALFGRSMYVTEYGYYENEISRIILEGGYILFVLRVLMLIAFLSKLSINSISKIALFFLLLIFYAIVYNIYNSIFIFLGLMLLDNSIIMKNKHISRATELSGNVSNITV